MMKDDQILINKTLKDKYTIRSKLKAGGFGAVYTARGTGNDTQQYAVKIIPKKHERYAIIEFQMYKQIQTQKYTLGFIKHYDYGTVNDNLFLAMQLLGPDLEEISFKTKGGKLSSKTGLMIGLQLIDRLQALHKIGYIHRDIKPDNLAIGLKQKNKIIYLFDFGLAKKVQEPLAPEEKGKIIGTLGYMSIRSHEGKETGILDDIESFVYTLASLIGGGLPWMKVMVHTQKDFKKIKLLKESFGKAWFVANNVPLQILDILKYIKGLQRKDNVDYLKVKYYLMNGLKSLKEQNDFEFDWCRNKKFQSKTNSPRKNVEQRQKIQKMNEKNQKLVQKEIYEIYKFINEDEREEKNRLKSEKHIKVNKMEQQTKKGIKEKQEKKEPKKEVRRPMSTKQERNPQKVDKQLQKHLDIFNSMKFEGPKIVINRTALHKI